MTVADPVRWLSEGGGLALIWRPGGWWARDLTLGPGIVALILDDKNGPPTMSSAHFLAPGARVNAPALLLRSGEVPLEVRFSACMDRESVPAALSVEFVVRLPSSLSGALLLRDACERSAGQLESAQLADELARELRLMVTTHVVAESWGEDARVARLLFSADGPGSIGLQSALFSRGLELRQLIDVRVESPELTAQRARRQELDREAQRVQERLEFLELWKREETGAALAQQEVERLLAHLRRDGSLRAIETDRTVDAERCKLQADGLRARARLTTLLERERIAQQVEIDDERLKYEIERARKLRAALEAEGLLEIALSCSDVGERRRLLAPFLARESLADATSTAFADSGRPVEFGSAADLSRNGVLCAEPTSTRVARADPSPRIQTIWLAAGLALYRASGDGAFDGGEVTPVLPPEELGYLRSVVVQGTGDEVKVLVGAQAGVAIYRPRGSLWTCYRFSTPARGKGGANRVALWDGRVYASHSELGLVSWPEEVSRPEEGGHLSQPFAADRIVPGRPTRGVQALATGGLCVAHGNSVFAVDRTAGGEPRLTVLGEFAEGITALNSTPTGLAVGTREGRVFLRGQSGAWRSAALRIAGPVYCLAGMQTHGATGENDGWVVGARQPEVTVLGAEGELRARYQAAHPIRWVGSGQQGVLAVDRFGLHLLLWRWDSCAAPVRRVRVPDQIQSLAVEYAARTLHAEAAAPTGFAQRSNT
ncbi:MAG: hypothetical protein ACKVX7_00330 [Planctomycetota bacterium]